MDVVSAQVAAATVNCAAWSCVDEALCGSEYCRRHLQLAETDVDDDLIVDDRDEVAEETLPTLAGRLVRSSKNLDRALRVKRAARDEAQDALNEFNGDLRAIRDKVTRMLGET